MESTDNELELWKTQNKKFLDTMGDAFSKAVSDGMPWFVNNYCLKCKYEREKCNECAYQIARHL